MNRFPFLLLLLLSLKIFPQGSGTPLIFRHLTAENGLISNAVKCIYQDHEGFIWIGTQDGLQRYDGYRFLTYRTNIHDPEGLQSDWINAIFEDSHHRLWFGSDAGDLYLFNKRTEKFYNYRKHTGNGNNLMRGVYHILEDPNGDIWAGGGNGIFKLNPTTNQFENYNSQVGFARRELPIILTQDKKGNIWISTNQGIHLYHCGEKKFYDRRHPWHNDPLFTMTGNIPGLRFDNENNAWVTRQTLTFNGGVGPSTLYKIDANSKKIQSYTFDKLVKTGSLITGDKEIPTEIFKDKSGHIFVILAWSGIAYYQPATDNFTITTINNESPYGLHGNYEAFGAIRPFVDREGNIWIGTDKCINIVNPDKQYFRYHGFDNDYHRRSDFPPYQVSSFLQTPIDRDIYLSYYSPFGGILRLDSNLTIKTHYLFPDNVRQPLGENQIWGLFQDRKGLIWAPTQAKSILKLNPVTGQLTRSVDSALYGNINIFRTGPNGDCWIGHWSRGLIRIDQQTGKATAFTKPPPPLVSPVRQINCLYIDEEGIGWAGNTEQGLLRFDTKEGRYTTTFLFEEGNRGSISSNDVTDIVPYNKDTLLVATNTGINVFDKKRHVFTSITAQDGLPSNHVLYLMIDDHRQLWAACLKGFCKIDIPTRKIVSYDVNEGLPDEVFSAPIQRLENGTYLVGQGNGFVAFHPDSVIEKASPPNVSLTGFRVGDRSIAFDSLVNSATPLSLSYRDNNISVDFAALQFYGNSNIHYYYQLEGVDRYWVTSGREQTARYNQLKGGEYTFRIKCLNRDGIPCAQETTLKIYIIPPFWQTWWFLLLVFIAVTALVFSIGRSLRDRKREKEMLQLNYEKKLAVMEMNTLRAQMNPHFIFNSLNSINTFILKNDSENATEYLIKFSQLVRLILDNSRTEWVLLENELKALALYVELEALRLDNTFTYSITTEPEVLKQPVIIPPLIIQPYVENAIWHGLLNRKTPGGRMTVDIKKENSQLIIRIEDNGIGREEADQVRKNRKHKSHGMDITAERLTILNEVYNVHAAVTIVDLKDDADKNCGTKVILAIDYKRNADIRY